MSWGPALFECPKWVISPNDLSEQGGFHPLCGILRDLDLGGVFAAVNRK